MAKRARMLTGFEFELDGDLMAVVENIYQEVIVRKELKHTYNDIKDEIENIVDQMSTEQIRNYLVESLFLNTVTYENQMLDALLEKLSESEDIDE